MLGFSLLESILIQQHALPSNHMLWLEKLSTCLEIEWTVRKIKKNIKDRVNFLMQGCQCKLSKCMTKHCSCVKQNKKCGPGCVCCDCHNREGKTILYNCKLTLTCRFDNPGNHCMESSNGAEASSSQSLSLRYDPSPKDSDTSDDEEKLEEEIIFMDMCAMDIVDSLHYF